MAHCARLALIEGESGIGKTAMMEQLVALARSAGRAYVAEMLRPALQTLLRKLLADSREHKRVTLDSLGEAVGALQISHDEIDALMHALEAQGRSIVGPEGGGVQEHLKHVIASARALSQELARKPSVAEIAARAKLSPEQVRHALALVQVMQR